MGFFDKFRKKQPPVEIPAEQQFTGTSIERDVTQDVALCMNALKITTMPILKFLRNDNGICEGVYLSHMNDPNVQMVRKAYGDDMYLNLLGCHALGSGAYVTLCQGKYRKPVEQFTEEEIIEIRDAFHRTDPYELAIRSLGYALDGNNKKCLDQITMAGLKSYRNSAGASAFDKDCIKSYMQVMFNAGVTIVLAE